MNAVLQSKMLNFQALDSKRLAALDAFAASSTLLGTTLSDIYTWDRARPKKPFQTRQNSTNCIVVTDLRPQLDAALEVERENQQQHLQTQNELQQVKTALADLKESSDAYRRQSIEDLTRLAHRKNVSNWNAHYSNCRCGCIGTK